MEAVSAVWRAGQPGTCASSKLTSHLHEYPPLPLLQITDGSRVVQVQNGVADMTKITAAGCAVTAMATAFIVAAPDDAVMASACALAVFG